MDIGTIILAISLVIIMFGMGLSLVKEDFVRLLQHPKAIIIGLINQIILLPIIAYLLIVLFEVETDIAIGVMILAACPGGPTSNLITHLAKGDTGLSISLTTVNSLITIFTIPFVVDFALTQFLDSNELVQINKLQTVIQIFAIVIIPVSIGMAIKNTKPAFADKMNKPVKIASAAVLFLVIIGLVLKKREDLIPYLQQAGLTALALNVATILIGFITAKIAKLNWTQSITISIESGIQNGTMAIAIASGILMNDNYAIAPAVYSLIMFFTGGAIIAFGMKTIKQKATH
ncbi:MAG: bile acid:sodium symporter family protein [Salibacteraceae bacterium]|nr:bile acid:sodium symporter family protein [Salibacteraceae bacterium]|tara:strand:+ start:68454 stop:69320 length:867 start_codon:yes stop_codon:yes gene_type:complete